MIALLQRVSRADVRVGGRVVGEIDRGLLVFLGVEKNDRKSTAERMAERLLGYRVFADAEGRMNLSVSDIVGGILLVPQFTLAADTAKGMRPSFHPAAAPDRGRALFDHLLACLRRGGSGLEVETGEFGADMQVGLVNDGPVTFSLKVNGG